MPVSRLMALAIGATAIIFTPAWAGEPDDRQKPQFEDFDTDGDGVISHQEFKDRRDSRFGEHDVDASGDLSAEEFGAALKGTPAYRFRGMALRRADKDGDKLVSQSEWVGMPIPAFDRLDDNDDGLLDSQEFQP